MSQPVDLKGMEHVLLQAMVEVLGEASVQAVVNDALAPQAQPAAAATMQGRSSLEATIASIPVSHIMEALERVHGVPGGRGLAHRIGRACFPYALRAYGEALGLSGTSFRLLPTPSKFRTFGMGLAELFNRAGDERVRLEEQGDSLLLHVERCPLCRGRHSSECICQLAVGVAEESFYWLSGGKIFYVQEVACAARGDPACIIQIDLTPLS